MNYRQYLVEAIATALKAGQAILKVYDSDFQVETKSDNSPLTLADKQSHQIIKSGLARYHLPMISEEGRDIPYQERQPWHLLWIVDPLDGTKEFVKRNGEFTVNIALVNRQRPVMGIVYAPVPDLLYFATIEIGAYKIGAASALMKSFIDCQTNDSCMDRWVEKAQKLPCPSSGNRPYTIVGSRSHGSPELEAFVTRKRAEKGTLEFIQAGSSLKICLVAEGTADIYPRLGPTMEWDTAAGQAVAECAGAKMSVYASKEPLQYNKQDLLNPWFIVEKSIDTKPTNSNG